MEAKAIKLSCILIFQLFQVPLEKEGQLGGPILAQEEIKAIFGSIPDILDVHTKIKARLSMYVWWREGDSMAKCLSSIL